MLKPGIIEDIVHVKLSDELIRSYLLELTCDKVDQNTFNLFVDRMRQTARVDDLCPTSQLDDIFDCCGTGGSGYTRYNTSTTVAFVVAAGGVKIAKFGNRSATSLSGSFDFLEAIGLGVHVPSKAVQQLVVETGLVFLFAPQYYPALGALAHIRRSITGSTIFNFLGPLLNPLRPKKRLIGTVNHTAQNLIANYLADDCHTERAFVVRANSGLDELDPCSNNHILDISPGGIKSRQVIYPQPVRRQPTMSLTPEENARIFNQLLCRPVSCEYFLDLVCMNSAAAFLASGGVSGMDEGVEKARELFISGAVKGKFEEYKRAYEKLVR